MLINTVILFLKDALPIFILAALLIASLKKQKLPITWLFKGIFSGALLMSLISYNIDFISQVAEGSGLERLFSKMYFLIYLIILVHFGYLIIMNKLMSKDKSAKPSPVLLITSPTILALVIGLNGANFLVYFTGYWSQSGAVQPLLLGIVLGMGISISIGILLYFFLIFVDEHLSPKLSLISLLLFGAGQLNQASNLLHQIDLLPGHNFLWDSNFIIEESSELGYFLTALFGYDATPTLVQFFVYITVVLLPIGTILFLKKQQWFTSRIEKFQEKAL